MAIAEINNSSALLPNITLGYEVFDTCSESANIYGTLRMLYNSSQPYIKIQNNFTNYKPNIIASIGPDSSSFLFVTANVMALFLIPEISYSASHVKLSVKQMFPSFFRTIPSDNLQVQVMLRLLKTFNWTWVAMVGSDDVYGRQGLQDLSTLAAKNGICIPYRGIIPYTTDITYIRKMVDNIVQSRVRVIVVFSVALIAKMFLEEAIKANLTGRVWMGSEDWSGQPEIASLPNIQTIGTIFGVSVSQIDFSKLLDFETAYVRAFKSGVRENCNQACDECRSFTLQNMSIPGQVAMSASFNVYAAVYAMAHGLHGLLSCRSGQCRIGTYYPWQLLQHVKKVNFTLYNQSIFFDGNGDPATGYDIIMWTWNKEIPTCKVVGSYSKTTQRLQLNERLPWNTKDGIPDIFTCMVKQPVFALSFTICFSCILVHAFQIVCIFKMASLMPKIYDIWVKKNGSDVFIAVSSTIQVLISVVWIVLKPPRPVADYSTYANQIILKCSETVSIGSIAELTYIGFLCMICFIFCYMGKDLPASSNEAKCISFSLLVYVFSWIAFFTTYIVYQGKYLEAVNVCAVLFSVLGILIGYFVPKCYVILFRPELNTTKHFQAAIQNYTKKKSAQE
ncbi:taste receptor type 1 member 1-like [Pyxicephalus adspersus]|uniref:taste receptor type 1 member 1-like n=1 Tax=Pyxicephalus adspersus TaxID=30357 RepID=UPI003B5A8928